MTAYAVLSPIWTRANAVGTATIYTVSFEPLRIIHAHSAEHAIRLAKKAGHPNPIVAPTQEPS